MAKLLTEFPELNAIANKMSPEAWGTLLVQGVLGDPDWYHDMVHETMEVIDKNSPNYFGQYHGVFNQFSYKEVAKSMDQFVEYIKEWEDLIQERIKEGVLR